MLKDNNLGPQGAQHLSEALKINTSVTELDIGNGDGTTGIGSEGVKCIADMLGINDADDGRRLASRQKRVGSRLVPEDDQSQWYSSHKSTRHQTE